MRVLGGCTVGPARRSMPALPAGPAPVCSAADRGGCYGCRVQLRTVHRALIAIAAAVCVLFVASLSDTAFVRLVLQEVVAPAVPDAVHERDGKLLVDVRNPSRTPVAGARVTVLWIRDRRAYLAGFAQTTENGRAAFIGLPRGESWVLVDADGRARASTRVVVGAEQRLVEVVSRDEHRLSVVVRGDDRQGVAGARVTLRCSDPLPFAGETDEEGKLELRRLCAPPYAVEIHADGYEPFTRNGLMPSGGPLEVGLRRLGSVLVRVILEDGSPAPLSTVLLSSPTLWPARQTQTTAFGRSTIAGLPSGTYDMRAERGDLVSDVISGIEVKNGEQTKVLITLRQGRRVVVHVVAGAHDDAPGVPDADVVLAEGGLSSFPKQGRTGPDGMVTLGPFAASELTASARAEGYVSPGAVRVGAQENAARIVMVKAGRLVGDVVDHRGFPVAGATLEVVGTDLSGQPISETPSTQSFRQAHFAWALPGPPALIPAGELGVMPGPIPPIPHGQSTGLTTTPGSTVPWVTDRNGEFSIGPVPPGRVGVIVRHPAYVETVSDAVTLGAGAEARIHVVLVAGGTIEGVVLDDRRYPIPGALVRISARDGSSDRTTITADDGSFVFSAVASDLLIAASPPEAPDRIAYEDKLQVGPDERKELEIVLQRSRDPVAVTVRDDRGYPVDAAQVTAISLASDVTLRRTTFTRADGTAQVEDGSGIALRMEVSAPGYATVVKTFEAAPKDVTVELRPGLRARGTVVARGGRDRVEGARVTVFLRTGMQRLVTNDKGEYELGDLEAGELRVRVDHDDYVAVEKTLRIEREGGSSGVVELDRIDLERAGIIEGEVVDDRGDPVAGARVAKDQVPEYLPVGPLPPGVVVTDAKGRFTLRGLPEGEVTVEAYAPGVGRGKEEKIAVRADRTTARVRVRIEKKAEQGGPVVKASVPITLREATGSAAGVLVASVVAGSGADRAGLKTGDLIVRIDGVIPSSVLDAQRRLTGPERREVLLEVQRGVETLKVRVGREKLRK